MRQTTDHHMAELIRQQLHNQFEIHEYDDQLVIASPMLYPDNSRIVVAIEEIEDGRFLLTDNGDAAGYAFVHGIPDHVVQTQTQETKRRFHLSDSESNELMLEVRPSEIAKGLFTLVSAIQDVGNLASHQLLTFARQSLKAR